MQIKAHDNICKNVFAKKFQFCLMDQDNEDIFVPNSCHSVEEVDERRSSLLTGINFTKLFFGCQFALIFHAFH
jgi:hypothetical protein